MLEHYQIHCKERMEVGIPPLPLSVQQTSELVDLLKTEHKESDLLLELLKERLSIINPDLLASKLRENGINFNDSLNPLTWVFDLLRASGSQSLNLDQFGITLHENIALSELKDEIYKEFLELSEAHYDRYFFT
ncbi:hypothetical protein N8821_02530 [Gammaproteobacteria bacterium]|nr:hypothetical protein [Gammaproteobacteria bacterium]